MKKISIGFLFFAASLVFASCANRDENGSTDTSNTNSAHAVTDSTRGDKPSGDTEASAMTNTIVDKETQEFVMKAASGNMLEVQMGQLAEQKGKSERVKNFGSMIVTDHSKANEELKGLAASNGLTLPTALMPDDQKHVGMMTKLSEADFDKEYIKMMIEDHNEDIAGFKKEANSNKKDAFTDFAAKTLPVLQKHLDSAKAIHNSKM